MISIWQKHVILRHRNNIIYMAPKHVLNEANRTQQNREPIWTKSKNTCIAHNAYIFQLFSPPKWNFENELVLNPVWNIMAGLQTAQDLQYLRMNLQTSKAGVVTPCKIGHLERLLRDTLCGLWLADVCTVMAALLSEFLARSALHAPTS